MFLVVLLGAVEDLSDITNLEICPTFTNFMFNQGVTPKVHIKDNQTATDTSNVSEKNDNVSVRFDIDFEASNTNDDLPQVNNIFTTEDTLNEILWKF